MIAFSLYDTVVYSNVWFFLDGVGLTLKNMTTCSTSVCLLVSILYVCTGCFVLFVSCNKKNCLECIFCHFHVVSLSLLGLFSCLIDGFQNGLATCRTYIIDWSFFQVQTHPEKSFWEALDAALLVSVALFGNCELLSFVYFCTIQYRLKFNLHHPECRNMPMILMVLCSS